MAAALDPSPDPDLPPRLGWVDPRVAEEHPALRLVHRELPVRWSRRSPRSIRQRLGELSGRVHGGTAIELRRQDVPAAWRVFFRHVGLDPDERLTPIEAAVRERLTRGGFPSRGLPADALAIALLETGVALWALDADAVDGPLGIRPGEPGETLGPERDAAGLLVVADDRRPLAELCGDPLPEAAVAKGTTRAIVFGLVIAGVPSMHVHEAFWTAADLLYEGEPASA